VKILKIVLIILGAVAIILIAAFGIYLLANKQGVIEAYEFTRAEAEYKVLIASQGSDFKNALVESLTTHLREKATINVIDVTTLHEVNEDEWDAIVLIHTVEQWKLQPDVKKYLDRAQDLHKIILVTTSGSGDWKTENYDVDVITSASKTGELPSLIQKILGRIDSIVSQE
jgi:menaquinone-dependent protoporphyrinogen IX oxidase